MSAIGGNSATLSSAELMRALAGHLEVKDSALDDYILDRHVNGNLTLRPLAVFG